MRGDEADIRWFDEEGDLFPASGTTIRSADLRSTSSPRRPGVRLRTESDIASATLVVSRGRRRPGSR